MNCFVHYTAVGTSGDMAVLDTFCHNYSLAINQIGKYEDTELAIKLIKRSLKNAVSIHFQIE